MLATLALYGLRRVSPERKRVGQFVLLGSTITIGTIAWAVRTPIIDALSASNELNLRLAIWRPIRLLIPTHQLEGWGWAGNWWEGIPPFAYIRDGLQPSALNAYLDVWLQVGLIGLFAFVFMVGLAFIRSWLLASRQRSFVYAWPALVLVVLLVTGLAESSLLVEFGWLTFVVCSVKASRELSWRKAFAATRVPSAFE
jgi:O-antigen ligase